MSPLDAALLVVRLVLGVIFIVYGSQKTFGWFGGSGIAGAIKMTRNLGSAHPNLLGWMAALSELGGGLLVLVGLFTPFAAALIISTMLVAISTVHFKKGFLNTKSGFEFNLSLIALVLVILGGGAISLDALLSIAEPITLLPIWAVALLVLVAVGGVVSTELSRTAARQSSHSA